VNSIEAREKKMRARRYWISAMALGSLLAGAGMGQEAPATPSSPTPMPRKGIARTQAQNERLAALRWKRFDYTCEGGAKITVDLKPETAKVQFQEHQYLMKQTQSADGNRYSDGKVLWWGKGNEGFLQEDAPDGNGKMMVKDCQLDKPLNAEASAGTVTGTVSYLQRMALPPNAVILVQLEDVSLADAATKVIAEENITLGDRQVPVPFTLKFDAGKIDARHNYALAARIVVAGELWFISERPYAVLTAGNPTQAEMVLKQVVRDGSK
jgi:putative lipoprotein